MEDRLAAHAALGNKRPKEASVDAKGQKQHCEQRDNCPTLSAQKTCYNLGMTILRPWYNVPFFHGFLIQMG